MEKQVKNLKEVYGKSGEGIKGAEKRIKYLLERREELERTEMHFGGIWWKEGKYLYKTYTNEEGKQVREYVGNEEGKVKEVMKSIERAREWKAVEAELEEWAYRVRRATVLMRECKYLMRVEGQNGRAASPVRIT